MDNKSVNQGSPTDIRSRTEAANARTFDREAESYLLGNPECLQLNSRDWKKIDERCPPSNAYIYALQRLGNVSGKNVLDFGCGDGYLSIVLAKRGAKVWAFDISKVSALVAKRRFAVNGTKDSCLILCASAFALPFKDNSFDHVVGVAVLHHVWFDMEQIGREIFRVLKSSGTAVFQEAFGNSRLLQVMRRCFPLQGDGDPETEQRQLRYSDFNIMREIFVDVRLKEFQIISRLDRILKNRILVRMFRFVDEWLLILPGLGRFARMVVVELHRGP